MDFNWFFSSLAQSVAAIIGIFMTFIISKILSNQSEFEKNKREISNLKNNIEHLKDLIRKVNFLWLIKNKRKIALENISADEFPEKLYGEAKSYHSNEEIDDRKLLFFFREEYFSVYDKHNDVFEETKNVLTGMKNISGGLFVERPYALINEVDEKATSVEVEINKNIREISTFIEENENNPLKSILIKNIITTVIFLFLLGVIMPLMLLPVKIGETPLIFDNNIFFIKSFLLFVISIVFLVMMSILYKINNNFNYNKEDIEYLREHCKIENYSEYFKNMVENQKLFKELEENKND